MKYLKYLWVLLKKPFGKLIGVAYTPLVAWWFRAYANNSVFNYVLQNNIHLPRLNDVPKSDLKEFIYDNENIYGWELYPYSGADGGYIRYTEVSKLKYKLVYHFLWKWLDSDNTSDVTARGYGEDILEGKHYSWFPKWLISIIRKEQEKCDNLLYGNYWELGDKRSDYPVFVPVLGFLWNLRNSYYNANYMEEECHPDSKGWFYIHVKSKGWHFGYLPKTKLDGSVQKRAGRMVWFTEDYDKI